MIEDLDHDNAMALASEYDNLIERGDMIRDAIEYDGPTVEIELPTRVVFDMNVMATHLLKTWDDDQCKDDAYLRHVACVAASHMAEATREAGHDLDDLIEYSDAIDDVRIERGEAR